MRLFISTLLLLCSQVHAGEYDEIIAQDYRARQAAAGEQELAKYAEHASRVGRFLQAYIQQNGGNPNEGSCRTSSGYSCKGSLCTPFVSSSLSIGELGTPGYTFRSCDFSLPGNRACKAGEGQCHLLTTRAEIDRCRYAALVISCVNRDTREKTGEYIDSLNTEARQPRKRSRSR